MNGSDTVVAGREVAVVLTKGRQSLQAVLSSNAFAVISRCDDASEALRFLSPDLRSQLPAAVEEMRAALKPASAEDLMAELARCLSLVAGALNQKAREEWLAAAFGELGRLPRDLVFAGLKDARRHCDHASKIIPFVIGAVERAHAERKAQGVMLKRLAEIAERPVLTQAEEHSEEVQAEIDALLSKLRTPRPGEEPTPRGITEADREKIRAGRPLIDREAFDANLLANHNMVRAANGLHAQSPEQFREELREANRVSMSRQLGRREGFDPPADETAGELIDGRAA